MNNSIISTFYTISIMNNSIAECPKFCYLPWQYPNAADSGATYDARSVDNSPYQVCSCPSTLGPGGVSFGAERTDPRNPEMGLGKHAPCAPWLLAWCQGAPGPCADRKKPELKP